MPARRPAFDVYGLTITGANALTIKLASGTLGSVTGPMIVNSGAHRLIGQAASAITLQNGSISGPIPALPATFSATAAVRRMARRVE